MLIIAGVPLAMIIVWRGKLHSAAAPDPAPLVSVVTATAQQISTKLVIVGTIEPVVTIDLGAREAGTLADTLFRPVKYRVHDVDPERDHRS